VNKVIVAPSGGGLPAAIGIVRLSGADTFSVLDRIFKAKCR